MIAINSEWSKSLIKKFKVINKLGYTMYVHFMDDNSYYFFNDSIEFLEFINEHKSVNCNRVIEPTKAICDKHYNRKNRFSRSENTNNLMLKYLASDINGLFLRENDFSNSVNLDLAGAVGKDIIYYLMFFSEKSRADFVDDISRKMIKARRGNVNKENYNLIIYRNNNISICLDESLLPSEYEYMYGSDRYDIEY